HEKNRHDDGGNFFGVALGRADKKEIDENQRDRDAAEEFEERAGRFGGADNAHEMTDETAGGVAKLLDDDGFKIVRLHHAVAREGFVHHLRQFGGMRLHGFGRTADFATEDGDGQDASRDDEQENQRQLRRFPEQDGDHADDDDRVLDETLRGVAEARLDGGSVAHDACDES